MAQTKKKRRSKHRGNAAGMVEARGRTGRKLTTAERKEMGVELTADEKRRDRMAREPTWKGAVFRAIIAAAVFFVVLLTLLEQELASAIALSAFVIVFYVPLGFYTDKFLYDRRIRRERERGRR